MSRIPRVGCLLTAILIFPIPSFAADTKLIVQNLAVVNYQEKQQLGFNGGELGESLATGDVDGDGKKEVITGAVVSPATSSQYPSATGNVVVMRVDTGEVLHSFVGTGPYYGDSVAFHDNGNQKVIAIGDPSAYHPTLGQTGSVQVRDASTGTVVHTFFGSRVNEQYGASMTILEDGSYVLGAEGVRYAASLNGPGRVEARNPDGTFRFSVLGTENRDKFGHAIVDAGQITGGPSPEILVSAPDANGYAGLVVLLDGDTGAVLSSKAPTGSQYARQYGNTIAKVAPNRFAVSARDGVEIIQVGPGGTSLTLVTTIPAIDPWARPNVFALSNGNILLGYPWERNPNTNVDRVGLVERYSLNGAFIERFYGDTQSAYLGKVMAEIEPGLLAFGEESYSSPRVQVIDMFQTEREVGMRCDNFVPAPYATSQIRIDSPAIIGNTFSISGQTNSPLYNKIFLVVGLLRSETSTGKLGNQGCRIALLKDVFSLEELNPGPNGEFSFTLNVPNSPLLDGLSIAYGVVATDQQYSGFVSTLEKRQQVHFGP